MKLIKPTTSYLPRPSIFLIYILTSVQTGFVAKKASYPTCSSGDFRGGKAAGREADHLTPSSAEVENDGAIIPIPHTSSWHGT
jgi:hypothetical protein